MTSAPRFSEFFDYARERYSIFLKREAGECGPWTKNPILRTYRFTNVFREDDRTTVWFREHVRERLRSEPECLLATVAFRWFNRIETGRILFVDPAHASLLYPTYNETPWEMFLRTGDTRPARDSVLAEYPEGPWVTGSYLIKSPTGTDKLSGILQNWRAFRETSGWRRVAEALLEKKEYFDLFDGPVDTRNFTRWLQNFPELGPFLAYEVACDLQHTDLLNHAADRMTWTNPGPGARRGLNRLRNRKIAPKPNGKHPWRWRMSEAQANEEIRELLELSRNSCYWPSDWPAWDMRTVEHTLCEFDKLERVRNEEGRPRQYFTPHKEPRQ